MTIEKSLSLSEVVKLTSIPINLLTNILRKIRQANTELEILQAGVEIVHQTLKCDRAVVYSLQSDSQGKIIAESVTAGYAQILGLVIKDPCFDAKYIEKYQKGRVRAIANIRDAGMSTCYIENLEKIDVQANLVVPLIRADRSLFGLLVMHQCSQPRQWKQSETVFVLQIADWVMETIEIKNKYSKLQTQLDNVGKWQELLIQTTKNIHNQQSVTGVLQTTVEQAKEILKCDRVVVYVLEEPNIGKVVAEVTIPALAPTLNTVIKDPCFEYRYKDEYQHGRVRAINDIYNADMSPCYVDNLAKIAVKSNLVVPINRDDGKIYGLLVAHQCFQFRDWQPEEIELLKQVGIQTGLALSKAELKEKLTMLAANSTDLEAIRDAVTIAKSAIKQTQQPIQDTSASVTEINQLNRLLNRELDSIDQTSSVKIAKETKLIKIMIKKLTAHTNKIKDYFHLIENKNNQVKELLEDAALTLYANGKDESGD